MTPTAGETSSQERAGVTPPIVARDGASRLGAGPAPSEVMGKTLVVVAVALAFWAVHELAGAFFMLFAGVVLGTAVRPAIDALQRRGLGRHLGAVLVFAALIGVVLAAAVLVVPVAMRQASTMAANAPSYVARARGALSRSESVMVRRFGRELSRMAAADLPPPGGPGATAPSTRPDAPPRASTVVDDLGHMGRHALHVIALILLAFHWACSGDLVVRALLLFAPLERRDQARELIEAAEAKVGGYVRGQLTVCAVTAALSLLAFAALGLPHALIVALAAGAMGALPVVGGALGAAVALLAATSEPHLIPWVLGACGSIHMLQEYVVAPRVLGKRVGVHPFTILLAISGFGSLLGVAGAVLAIPMAAILQLLLDRFVFDTSHVRQPAPPLERDRRAVLALEARTLALDARRQAREGAAPGVGEAKMMVESIANDLDRLLTTSAPRPTS